MTVAVFGADGAANMGSHQKRGWIIGGNALGNEELQISRAVESA